LSVQQLQAEIESKAAEEVSKILDTARQEAQKIVVGANAKAAGLRDERTKALTRELEAQERVELAITRMGLKGELLRLRSEWANRVFEEAGKRIVEMAEKGGRGYDELLINLILEGIASMNATRFIVETNSRDKQAVTHVLRIVTERAGKIKNGKVVLTAETLPTITLGGVVVSSEDRVQCFNNTLEARLSAATRSLGGEVHRILFGAGQTDE
jgi:vacuolar-type H+-ATPase subunit E/Vma4